METIYKLQPTRTIRLQGFSDFGAAAALHSASETGFQVSSVFRDAADFAVLVLCDRDDFFGHPHFSDLPDGDFSGIVLTFDLACQDLQPIAFRYCPVTLSAALFWSGINFLTATVHSYDSLNLRHAALGIGEASFGIFALAILADFYPEDQC